MISTVAQEYGITPRQAAEEIEADAEGLAVEILPLRRYAEAFAAWKRGNADELKAWRDNPMMRRIEEYEFAKAHRDAGLGE